MSLERHARGKVRTSIWSVWNLSEQQTPSLNPGSSLLWRLIDRFWLAKPGPTYDAFTQPLIYRGQEVTTQVKQRRSVSASAKGTCGLKVVKPKSSICPVYDSDFCTLMSHLCKVIPPFKDIPLCFHIVWKSLSCFSKMELWRGTYNHWDHGKHRGASLGH